MTLTNYILINFNLKQQLTLLTAITILKNAIVYIQLSDYCFLKYIVYYSFIIYSINKRY